MSVSLELAPLPQMTLPPEVMAELESLIDQVELLIESSWAENTKSRYTRQWARFERWCEERSMHLTLPVPVELVQLYLAHWVTQTPETAWSTIAQAHAAIRWVHRVNDVPPPTSVRLDRQLAGMRRKLGVAPRRQAAPLRLHHLRAIVGHYARPPRANLRDGVVVALRFDDWSYGEIVGLTMNQLVEVSPHTATLRMNNGELRTYIGSDHPIVTSLNAWLPVRGGFPGPVAVRVDGLDTIAYQPIPRQTVAHIMNRWSGIAGVSAIPEHQQQILDTVMQPRPADVRDVAVLLLLWAGALRSDELVRIRIRDLEFDDQGLTIHIRSSKTDQQGKGETKVIPRSPDGGMEIVGLVQRWITMMRSAGAEDSTPVFVGIDRHDNLTLTVIDPSTGNETVAPPCATTSVTDTVRRALLRAIPDIAVSTFSSHSGKRGIATELAHAGADVREIMNVTGHKHATTAMRYIEEVDRWTSSALRRLQL